jgi:hypothetical protein
MISGGRNDDLVNSWPREYLIGLMEFLPCIQAKNFCYPAYKEDRNAPICSTANLCEPSCARLANGRGVNGSIIYIDDRVRLIRSLYPEHRRCHTPWRREGTFRNRSTVGDRWSALHIPMTQQHRGHWHLKGCDYLRCLYLAHFDRISSAGNTWSVVCVHVSEVNSVRGQVKSVSAAPGTLRLGS